MAKITRQGRRALRRHRARVRIGGGLAGRDPGRARGGGDVVVIRYEGPKGGPGMREMLSPTGAIMGKGLGRQGGADHRRALFGRQSRICGRACHP